MNAWLVTTRKRTYGSVGVIIMSVGLLVGCSNNTQKEANEQPLGNNAADSQVEEGEIQFDIHPQEYHRYLLAKHTTAEYLLRMIREQGELPGTTETELHRFRMATLGDWFILEVDSTLSFYNYHNLSTWFYGYEEDPDIPELSLGYVTHRTDQQKDFIFYTDPGNPNGDTQIGSFRDNQFFFVRLPDAFLPYGNLTILTDYESNWEEIMAFVQEEELDLGRIESLTWEEYEIPYQIWRE